MRSTVRGRHVRRAAEAPRRRHRAAASGRRRAACAADLRGASRATRAPLDRHALARLAKQTAIAGRAAAETQSGGGGGRRCVQRDDAGRGRRDAAGTVGGRRGHRRVELPLPDDVAGVVVDRVDVVRAAGHERHRDEQRHAVRGHALRRAVQRRAAGCRASSSTAARSRASTTPSTEILSSARTHDVRCASPSAVSHCVPPRPIWAKTTLPAADADDASENDASDAAVRMRHPLPSDSEAIERRRRRSRCRRGRWRRSVR